VYQSGTDRQSDIWLLPVRTGFFSRPGKPIRLTNGPLPYSNPYPSRDGKQIFAFGTKQRGELVRYDMKSHHFEPFLSGISATDPTFSRDGKWVAYATYPDHSLWRSRSDGSERMQLTYPPLEVIFPSISPDGTKVAFYTEKREIFVISMEGGQPQRIVEGGAWPNWSPDGNYLTYESMSEKGEMQIIDLRTMKKSALPSSEMMGGFWITQDTLVAANKELTKFLTYSLKTQKWTDLGPNNLGSLVNAMISPDRKYLCFTTGGAEPKVERIRFSDQRTETIAGLKDFQRVLNYGFHTEVDVAPDGSPVFTRDTGYQEIYALSIRWP
jgi:hypothetical protein